MVRPRPPVVVLRRPSPSPPGYRLPAPVAAAASAVPPAVGLLMAVVMAVVMVVASVVVPGPPAAAQADGPTTTTTEGPPPSPEPSTTVPGPTSTAADGAEPAEPADPGLPPPAADPTPPESADPAPGPEPPASDDPLVNEPVGEGVPGRDPVDPGDPGDPEREGSYAGQPEFVPSPILWSQVRAAEGRLAAAEEAVDEAVERVRTGRRRRKALDARRQTLGRESQDSLTDLAEAEQTLVDRSIAAFVGADVRGGVVVGALEAADHDAYVDGWIRSELLDVALEQDDRAIADYRRLRARLDRSAEANLDTIRRLDRLLAADESAVERAVEERDRAAEELAVFAAGSAVHIDGARFPVAWPYDTPLIDSWGFPRMPGTPDEHWHEGIDVFAPAGTPLLAAEGGVVTRVGIGRLGGLSLWLQGDSGAHWYYAHLQSFAPGLTQGDEVEAGEVVGFVGNTGNAVGTPPHLHLQLHPDGGSPVNPYPLLQVLSERQRAVASDDSVGADGD